LKINFNQSTLQGRELDYIHETIKIGQVAWDETFFRKRQKLIKDAAPCIQKYI
jgi:hypothetical protein